MISIFLLLSCIYFFISFILYLYVIKTFDIMDGGVVIIAFNPDQLMHRPHLQHSRPHRRQIRPH